jgi:hypothetical protein
MVNNIGSCGTELIGCQRPGPPLAASILQFVTSSLHLQGDTSMIGTSAEASA